MSERMTFADAKAMCDTTPTCKGVGTWWTSNDKTQQAYHAVGGDQVTACGDGDGDPWVRTCDDGAAADPPVKLFPKITCQPCTCKENEGGYRGTYSDCGDPDYASSYYGPFTCDGDMNFRGHGSCPVAPDRVNIGRKKGAPDRVRTLVTVPSSRSSLAYM
jgi:hypothetical protein